MMRRLGSRVRAGGRVLTGSASTAAAALGLLVCLCTLLAVVGPRAAAQLRTGAFRQLIAGAPATDKAVFGTISDATLGAGQPLGLDAGLMERTKDQLRGNLTTLPLSPVAADWSSLTTPFLAATGYARSAVASLPPQLELSYRDALARNARVIAGRLPGGIARSGFTVIVQAAVTEATARRFGLRVGSRLGLPGTTFVLAVTALVQPRDPAAPFWTADAVLAAPQLQNPTTQPYWAGGVFIPASAVGALQDQINVGQAQVTWVFPLALGRLTAARAARLQSTLARALETGGHISLAEYGTAHGVRYPVQIALSSGVGQLIAAFDAAVASVDSVLDLLAVSLAVLTAVVVLLAGWLLAEQRRLELAILRARGASRRQLALTVFRSTAVAALPGAVAGAAIAVRLTPSVVVTLSWWLAGLVVLAALAGPVAITVRTHRGYAAVVRPDTPPPRLSAVRRLVVEAALVLGAAGGLAVLRYKGSGAGDLYASAAPVLLAIGVAVVLVRAYPLLVRGVLRLTGQRAGPTAFLGLARAARVSAAAALPAFAMVLALALVSFGGMVRGTVLRGDEAASWQQAGADAVITGTGPLTAALERAVAAVPGVQRLAVAGIAAGASGNSQFEVLAVDPGQYAALVAGTPLPQPPPAFAASAKPGPVPALAAPVLAGALGHGSVSVIIGERRIRVRVVGQAASMSALANLSGDCVVLPRQALGGAAPRPTTLLVRGPELNQALLRAAVAQHAPGGTIVFRSGLLAGLEYSPLQHGAYLALALGAVAAGLCCLLTLLLSLLLSAPGRRATLARMSTMGLSVGQGRVLGVVELVPQLVAVLAGGLGCAVALVPLIGPALSLGVFTQSASSVPVRVEPQWLVVVGAGLLVLAVVTLSGQTLLTDRTTARSLRIGSEA